LGTYRRFSTITRVLNQFLSGTDLFLPHKFTYMQENTVITQTANWVKSVVIGCNFCPFAAKALLKNSIRYVVQSHAPTEKCLAVLVEEMQHLDTNPEVETTLLIFPNDFVDFEDYLDLVALAEELVEAEGYEGVYQVASFHPEYCFEGAATDDAANYTNRSIYPMLHLLREDSLSAAIDHFPDVEGIPDRNIQFARRKGLQQMMALRAACLEV
jgi:uncharacterized protein